uniref:Uncharacterized protein n=1 Tax=Globodera rostochiensis TaxID=31243 RepID=A0A914I9N9_GLORO
MLASQSILSLLMLTIGTLVTLPGQRRSGEAEAFLLTHRNLLIMFASSKFAKLDKPINNEVYRRHDFVKVLLPETLPKHKDNNNSAKNSVPMKDDDQMVDAPRRVHSRRKRLHQLCILRRIGTPRWTVALFKQQKRMHLLSKRMSFDLLWML